VVGGAVSHVARNAQKLGQSVAGAGAGSLVAAGTAYLSGASREEIEQAAITAGIQGFATSHATQGGFGFGEGGVDLHQRVADERASRAGSKPAAPPSVAHQAEQIEQVAKQDAAQPEQTTPAAGTQDEPASAKQKHVDAELAAPVSEDPTSSAKTKDGAAPDAETLPSPNDDVVAAKADEEAIVEAIGKEEPLNEAAPSQTSETSPSSPAKKAAPKITPEELQQRMRNVEKELNLERARVVARRDSVLAKPGGKKLWNKMRGGAVKRIFNLKERLQVLSLMKVHPGKTFYEQVELAGFETPSGEFVPARKTPPKNEFDKYRVADYAAVEGSSVQLGDLKTATAIMDSIKGGLSRNLKKPTLTKKDIEGSFNKKSSIAKQVRKEQRLIDKAQQAGGKVVLIANDPVTGARKRILVDPSDLSTSRISTYNESYSN
jgi:hypothetical protein